MADISDIARGYLAAYDSHDPARVIAFLAPGATQENVATGLKHETAEEFTASLSAFFNAVPDARWIETQLIPAGDTAVIVYMLTGHLTNDLGPLKARGQAIDHAGLHVLKIRDDGKVVSAQDIWDSVEFARMLEVG
jgi:predicted ester cyclase